MPVRHETSLALHKLNKPLVGKFCEEICSACHLPNFGNIESRDHPVVGLAVFVWGVVGNVYFKMSAFFQESSSHDFASSFGVHQICKCSIAAMKKPKYSDSAVLMFA
jgi:hypothetical protein